MSTIHETIHTLEEFNKWRRGNDTITMPDSFEVGVAIGDAVRLLRELAAMTSRAEKAEDELKQIQSSALTWARFAGDKAACADIAEQRARITERLWKEFITLMDITEESDSGYAFNPNKISSCRAMDGKRLDEILNEARQIIFKQ